MIRFLGGVHFAIILIAAAALFVIAGTILESIADSHLYAASFTYDNPLFTCLLGLFFINILVSALRRWPFRRRHIPFLITHLGLLMVIGGVIIKNIAGVQGALVIREGSGSHQITLPHTQVVEVKERDTNRIVQYSLDELELLAMAPHTEAKWESWIKGNQLHIAGLPALELNRPAPIRLHHPESAPWTVIGCYAADVEEVASHLYKQGLKTTVTHRLTGKKLKPDSIDLKLTASPSVTFTCGTDTSRINLTNLKSENLTTSDLATSPYSIDFDRDPLVAFIKDRTGAVYLFAFDQHGRVHTDTFPADSWSSVVVYEEGFGGYAAHAKIPFQERTPSREEVEIGVRNQLKQVLGSAKPPFTPPLEMLRQACIQDNKDFAEVCVAFLERWDQTNSWLFPQAVTITAPVDSIIANLEWSPQNLKAARWVYSLYPRLQEAFIHTGDLASALKKIDWPLEADSLTAWAEQIFMVAPRLPEIDVNASQPELFSALLRAYGIHYADIKPEMYDNENPAVTIESSLSLKFTSMPELIKREDNRPAIKIHFEGEEIALRYDPFGTGLPWPTKSGRYLLHYKPGTAPIPYHIRVRDARQINYANSNQPYSYECDILVDGKETTLSMNEVYETWDGYRFYLAAISPGTAGEVQQVRIVVNRDPAKYWLTYPGAIILTLGIILVLWFRNRF